MYQVLFVDDEALIRDAVSETVPWEQLGYELAAGCENGKQASEYVKNHKVDLVITDICMPYMDGLELSSYLKREYPWIEIIILSGYDDFEYAKRAIQYRVSEYLLKPMTASELSEVLQRTREKLDGQNRKKEQLSKLNRTYHRNQLLMKSNALVDLLLGNKPAEESEKEFMEAGMELRFPVYLAAIVEIDLYCVGGDMNEKSKRESALMAFVVYNVVNEMIKGHRAGEVCQGRDQRTMILFAMEEAEGFQQSVRRICKEIQTQLHRIMGFDITIGMGKCVTEPKDIYQSCSGAKEMLEYRYILGMGQLIDRERIEGERKRWPGALGEIKNLMHCIKKNDRNQMQCYLEDLKQHMKQAILSRNRVCMYLQQITEEIGETLSSLDMTASPSYGRKEQVITQLYEATSFLEAAGILEGYCFAAAEDIDNEKNVGGKKYALLAMDYIETHYGDSQISLNSICGHLNISASRFSSIFKKATGETFMEVLIRIRMEKSRELLRNTDLKNYEIAEKVGFSDPHYFSVVFKKMTGKTPSEYAREER